MSWSTVSWEVARAGGLTAFALLTVAVALGMALSLRASSSRWPRVLTSELHRFVTLLALVFSAVHAAAIWLDPLAHFGLADVLVPFRSGFAPFWTGLGILALELSAALWISTALRSRIGYARWRRLHYLAFAVYAFALLHGILTGTDSGAAWATAIYVSSGALVGGLVLARVATRRPASRRAPAPAPEPEPALPPGLPPLTARPSAPPHAALRPPAG